MKRSILFICIPLVMAFSLFSFNSSPVLLKDINISTINAQIVNDSESVILDDYLFYVSDTIELGKELWKTNGVDTHNIADIYDGAAGSSPRQFKVIGNKLVFLANESNQIVSQLFYTSNGTSGVNKINLNKDYRVNETKVFDSILYFTVSYIDKLDEVIGQGIWSYDGQEVVNLANTPATGDLSANSFFDFMVKNERLYFIYFDRAEFSSRLYSLDSTGNWLNLSPSYSNVHRLYDGDSNIYVSAESVNSSGIDLLHLSEEKLTIIDTFMDLLALIPFAEGAIVHAKKDDTGYQAWHYANSTLAKIGAFENLDRFSISHFTNVEDYIYFSVENELYRFGADGSKLIDFGQAFFFKTDDSAFFVHNEKLLLTNQNGFGELWLIDGVTSSKLFDKNSNGEIELFKFQQNVNFFARSANSQLNLYQVDFNSQSVVPIKEVDSFFEPVKGSTKYFLSRNLGFNGDLYQLDTDNLISEVALSQSTGSSEPENFSFNQGLVFFTAQNEEFGKELWRSDRVATSVVDTNDGNSHGNPEWVSPFLDGVIFFAINNTGSSQLWYADDISNRKVSDLLFSRVEQLAMLNGQYYTIAASGEKSLYRITKDGLIAISGDYSSASNLFELNGKNYFFDNKNGNYFLAEIEDDSINYVEQNDIVIKGIFKADTTSEKAYFLGEDEAREKTLFIFDGVELKKIQHGNFNIVSYRDLYVDDDLVVLHGDEQSSRSPLLWKVVDNKIELISEVGSNINAGHPRDIRLVNGNLFYMSIEFTTGRAALELNIYNGTELIKTGLQLDSYIVGEKDDSADWLLGKEKNSTMLQLYDFSGSSLNLNNTLANQADSISNEFIDAQKVEDKLYVSFLRIWEDVSSHRLVAINQDGSFEIVNPNQEFHFGSRQISQKNKQLNTASSRDLFLKACSEAYGCEPYFIDFNQKPMAKIVSEKLNYTSGELISLDASQSSDSDGSVEQYIWREISATVQSMPREPMISFVAPEVEEDTVLNIELLVLDNDLGRSKTNIELVISPNPAPTILIDTVQSADEGETVVLDASGSTDQNDQIVEYLWTQLSGVTVTIDKSNESIANFQVPTIDKDEVVELSLKVTDSFGKSATEVFTLRLLNKDDSGGTPPPQPPTTEPPSNNDGGGGGSSSLLMLLMLLAYTSRRFPR